MVVVAHEERLVPSSHREVAEVAVLLVVVVAVPAWRRCLRCRCRGARAGARVPEPVVDGLELGQAGWAVCEATAATTAATAAAAAAAPAAAAPA